jgi:adenylate cyclase
LPTYAGAVAALPQLESAARGNGALNFTPDADGVVRRLPLLLRLRGDVVAAFHAARLRRGEGGTLVVLEEK